MGGGDGRGKKIQDRIVDTTLLEGQTQPLESNTDLSAFGGWGEGGMAWMGVGIQMHDGIVDTT